jgi:hypothetical protein
VSGISNSNCKSIVCWLHGAKDLARFVVSGRNAHLSLHQDSPEVGEATLHFQVLASVLEARGLCVTHHGHKVPVCRVREGKLEGCQVCFCSDDVVGSQDVADVGHVDCVRKVR